jgi:NADH dehydrogenase [ubiquinone] 1 alpha subcomplex assembly factor 7
VNPPTSLLAARIAGLIAAQGPMSIGEFMTVALHDPAYGYYATRDPLGTDFITAPEISQMFGELVGLWLVQCWFDQGKPSPARLVELGPGRGTLMADALRAARVAPEFLTAIEVVLVEASPALRAIQERKLQDAPVPIRWCDGFDKSLSDKPLFLIANEFFDALPIRQYVKTDRGWCERMLVTDQSGALAFSLAPVPAQLAIPASRGPAALGAVYEVSASASAIAEEIGQVIAARGGAALIIDYGYDATGGFGETFQALGGHSFKELLAEPGDVDLSAHVDFGALARAFEAGGGVPYGPQNQGDLLEALGIRGRAERLVQANPERRDEITAATSRLVEPDKMGRLFQALAVVSPEAPAPPAFDRSVGGAVTDDVPTLLQAENLGQDPDIEHGFFGRRGGASKGLYASLNCGPGSNDVRNHVLENRARALGELAPDATLVTLYQVHSARVVTVTEPWVLGEGPKADAMVTDRRDLALGILTADCAPVLFADAEAKVIGAAHAGWKGALAGVTDQTILAMEALGARRERIAAAIGPCIGQANYEVGPEFRAAFLEQNPDNARFFIASGREAHFRFDLEGYVVHRLKEAQIGSVEPLSACTYARESEFFSFRRATHRSEPDYGREISLIVLL